jgi:putative aldouronate transport system permease protein
MKKSSYEVLKKNKKTTFLKEIIRNYQLYIMALPAIILLFLFCYLPMGGIIIAFKNFKFKKGIFGSSWSDPLFKNFEILVNNSDAFRAVRNTIILNVLFIVIGTICALTLAILINETKNKIFKKVTQSITFLPFFMSWIVVGIFVAGILSYENGSVNRILDSMGIEKIMFYAKPKLWPAILAIVNVWKGVGYSAVVYLATIAGIDATYYEAAQIDGASRWQLIRCITLPLLKPTVVILTLLSVGRIMNSDFGLFFNVTRDISILYPTTDVIDTFIYRGLRLTGNIGISSAAGFFQSIVSFAIVLTMNQIVNKYQKDSALF